MLRAVPSTIFAAPSMSAALRSGIFVLAISSTCSRLTAPTLALLGSPLPFSRPAACFRRNAAGGVLVTKVNERSSYTVISTGTIWPICSRVASLNCRTNSPMFTWAWPSAGPTGGAGFACPPVICNFSLRATRRPRPLPIRILSLELGYLVEGELHGRLAPEDGDEHLQPRLVHVDVRDRTREIRERPSYDLDRLPDLVIHRRLDLLACLDLARMQKPLDLGAAERERLLPGADDLGDPRRLAHELPGRVVHVHVHEDVARELALDRRYLLAVLDLDDALGRDADLTEAPAQAHGVDPALQRRAHLVLVPRVCIYDVPLLQNETLLMPTGPTGSPTRRPCAPGSGTRSRRRRRRLQGR